MQLIKKKNQDFYLYEKGKNEYLEIIINNNIDI